MKPHNQHAPGLPSTGHYSRIIHRRPHSAQFAANKALVGCSCGRPLDGDEAYAGHLKQVNAG